MGRVIPKLETWRLTKSFGTKSGAIDALLDVDIKVDPGELVCLVGASGCGKSTRLSIAAGLVDQTSGSVMVDGREVSGPGSDRGLVFQSYSLFPWRTVRENIAFGLELAHMRSDAIASRVDELLTIVGLERFADALPKELSGGMQQRTAIARAMAPDPAILLLDEPFGALDAQTRASMQEFLLNVWRETHKTILMVTHDVEEAVFLSQRIYVMSAHPGRIADEIIVPFPAVRHRHLMRERAFQDVCERIDGLLALPVAS